MLLFSKIERGIAMRMEMISGGESSLLAVIDVDTLVRNWWIMALRGVAGILFGLFTVVAPDISLAALVLVFGAFAFADGVLALVSAVRRRGVSDRWWVLLLQGLAGVAAGVVTVLWPDLTTLALLYLIAAWALVIGALELAAAIRLRKVITGEWLLALGGIAAIGFGVLLILFPQAGALAVVLWIGAYALVAGALLLALSFRLRSWGRSQRSQSARGAALST
jgi:uncharacterized membrane protein HdeD (DUF308 family)